MKTWKRSKITWIIIRSFGIEDLIAPLRKDASDGKSIIIAPPIPMTRYALTESFAPMRRNIIAPITAPTYPT